MQTYFDVSASDQKIGRITFRLFDDVAPITAENFRALCTGENGFGYSGSHFHRILPSHMLHGGDITRGNGTGGKSIYGPTFADENFNISLDRPGLLFMYNKGPNTNNSQFCISITPLPFFDGRYVVFGEVEDGMDVVKTIETYGSGSGAPLTVVTIDASGEL